MMKSRVSQRNSSKAVHAGAMYRYCRNFSCFPRFVYIENVKYAGDSKFIEVLFVIYVPKIFRIEKS